MKCVAIPMTITLSELKSGSNANLFLTIKTELSKNMMIIQLF